MLNHCPECGATGDYKLLKERAQAVLNVFRRPGFWSATNDADFNKALEEMEACFDKDIK